MRRDMKVRAKPGTRCPMEGRPREYITDQAAVKVPDTAYYRRRLAEGSLVPAGSPTKAKAKNKGGTEA